MVFLLHVSLCSVESAVLLPPTGHYGHSHVRQEGSAKDLHVRIKMNSVEAAAFVEELLNTTRTRLDPCCPLDRRSVAHYEFEASAKADDSLLKTNPREPIS